MIETDHDRHDETGREAGQITRLPVRRPGQGPTQTMVNVRRSTKRGTMAELTDEDLIVRTAAGDETAARLLMAHNLPRVYGMARRMLGDAHEAEDVAQETFLRVWKAAPRFEVGRAKVSTWIGRIAMNACYDRLRKRREVFTDSVPETADETVGAEAAMEQSETRARVVAALGALPDRQRQAIELVHFQEMSNIKAAEIMAVSVEAMESLLSRGRRKLKQVLAREADDLVGSFAASPLNPNEGMS